MVHDDQEDDQDQGVGGRRFACVQARGGDEVRGPEKDDPQVPGQEVTRTD